jgi:tRNA (guanine-N7-)-methyltransferase
MSGRPRTIDAGRNAGNGVRTTKRRGRLGPAARAALDTLAPRWTMAGPPPWTSEQLDEAFGRSAARMLDIGCGNGAAARAWATVHPDGDVVAVELHRPGLARLLRDLEADGPPNIRAAEVDAVELLDQLRPGSFCCVRIHFPDPWPKRRHRARRMVDPAFVARVADLLPVGGLFHVATDWTEYAIGVRQAIELEERFAPMADRRQDPWMSLRPDRPITTYERRALDAGRTVTDLVAHRVTRPPAAAVHRQD